jgi:selenocysteine lyase/cysteine desulfurase
MATDDVDSFRSFGGIDDETIEKPAEAISSSSKGQIIRGLRESIIGAYEKFVSPYGDRPIIYADWTASGKCVRKVEDYVTENVIPLYGNTHTTTSITGHQTTCFRHEARQIVAEAVNAKITGRAAVDVVVFTGNGSALILLYPLASTKVQDQSFLPPVMNIIQISCHG